MAPPPSSIVGSVCQIVHSKRRISFSILHVEVQTKSVVHGEGAEVQAPGGGNSGWTNIVYLRKGLLEDEGN